MSSKKTKKQKWKPIETEVISIASGTCWADEVEKEQNGFGGYGYEAKPLNLPKAPRAACDTIIDEASVPQEGPFLVHMSNLQFEIEEDDLTNYFKGLKIVSIKLPRNDNGRNKGFGYVEFEERKELIVALGMENLIRGRRVRVELASGMQDSRNAFQRGSRMGMDFKSDEPGDWRSTNRTSTTEGGFPRRRDGNAFDKDHDSERDNGPWRGARQNVSDDVVRKPFSDRHYDDSSESGGRRPFGDRRNNEFETGGRRPFGERRDDVDGGRKPFSDSRRGFGFKRDDDLPEIAGSNTLPPQERPKLILKPKTVDPDAPKTETQSYVSSSSIFGGAKPVDTAAKEREIEEKLLTKHEPKPLLSAASSVTSLNDNSDANPEEVEVKPVPQAKSVETWRRRSPRRQNDDDRLPRRRVSPDRNPKYEEAPPPRENVWTKHSINKEPEISDENICNGTSAPSIEEDNKPKLNVYIPPNLRKKQVSEEQVLEKESIESVIADDEEVSARTEEFVTVKANDLVLDQPELETSSVGLDDVRTDPDGQSSEPEVGKEQLTTEGEDKNDSGFIECDKSKKKPKVAKKVSDVEIKKKDPVVTKEQKKSTSNKYAALLDDGSNE